MSSGNNLFLILALDQAPHTPLSPTYALKFSIAIIRVSVCGGTRLLGKVDTSRGEVLALIKQKQSKDHIGLAASDYYADIIGSFLPES